MSKKSLLALLSAFLVFLAGAIDNYTKPMEVRGTSSELVQVTKVIDGDTIQVEGEVKVRLIGVDTPETVDPRRPDGCFGKNASEFTKNLLLGKLVRLEIDVSETDRYGRLLRYVWLDEKMVNEFLVAQGYAQVSTYPPDVKYQDRLLQAQTQARQQNKGLWGACER